MDGKIRILYVIGQLGVGGTEFQLLELVRNIDQENHEVGVVCLSGENIALADRFTAAGHPPVVLHREAAGRLRTLWRLFKTIGEFKPDIVHSFSYASRAGLLTAKLAGGRKTVVSFRNDPVRWVTSLDRRLIDGADLILENSKYALGSYLSLNGGRGPESRVIYNGIDLGAFDSASRRDAAPPLPPAFGSGDPVICTISRLVPQKRLEHLLEAFACLRARHPQVDLWIVGDGPLRGRLEEHARSLGIHDRVYFWGTRYDVAAILRHATLGVHASEYEGLPNAVIEYMACGLPVVATDVRGTNELVVDGETGLLVGLEEPQAFADAISFLVENPASAGTIGRAGRRRVETMFTLDRMVRETENAYAGLTGKVQG